jgi:hypothetical protein
MAATDDIITVRKQSPYEMDMLCASGESLYLGTLAVVNTSTGKIVSAGDDANRRFVGVHAQGSEGSALTADTLLPILRHGVFKFKASSVAQTLVGKLVYLVDNETVDETSTNKIPVGRCVKYISATECWVDISDAWLVAIENGASLAFTGAGATLVHEAALSATDVQSAIVELQEEFDDHICESGAGSSAASPGTNREHFAGAIAAHGSGIAYYVTDSGAGIVAKTVVREAGESAGLITVQSAANTIGHRDGLFYAPSAIGAAASGWVYDYYVESASGLDNQAGAIGDPVWLGAAGALTLTEPVGSAKMQGVGRCLDTGADAKVLMAPGRVISTMDTITLPLSQITTDGTDAATVTPLFDSSDPVVVRRCFASASTNCSNAAGVVIKLNTVTVATIANGTGQAEDKTLGIAVAANTDFVFTLNAAIGDAIAGVTVVLECFRIK